MFESPRLSRAWFLVLTRICCKCHSTPGVSFEGMVPLRHDTASRNPFTDNGIKLVNKDGYKMDEDVPL